MDKSDSAKGATLQDAAQAKPQSLKPKPKMNPAPVATKAEIAAKKRLDKTVIKRMRKR